MEIATLSLVLIKNHFLKQGNISRFVFCANYLTGQEVTRPLHVSAT